MHRKSFLIVTSVGEGLTGLALLALPTVVLRLLLGVERPEAETLVAARIAGAALVAIGVMSWLARDESRTPAAQGLLTGILIYDASAAVILALAGTWWGLLGIALWPAVALHAALAFWCSAILVGRMPTGKSTIRSGQLRSTASNDNAIDNAA